MELDGVPPTGPTGNDEAADVPLTLLADLRYPTSGRFLPRVRERIERRLLVSHVTSGVLFGPVAVLLEYVYLAMGLLVSRSNPGNPDEPR